MLAAKCDLAGDDGLSWHVHRRHDFHMRSLRFIHHAVPYVTAGIGSSVVNLIFSIAKREVTFFSGTVAISFL